MLNILILLTQFILYSNCYEITRVGDQKTLVGVSPFYDAEKNSLIYLDSFASFVFKPVLFRHDFATNKTYAAKISGLPVDTKLGFIIPFEGSEDLYAIGAGRNFEVVQWDGKSSKAKLICTQFEIEPIETNFVHGGLTDKHGRFWTESLRRVMCDEKSNAPPGRIFMSNDAKTVKPMIGNMKIANDFIIDEDRNIMYYGDSCIKKIKAVDVDPETGDVSNERVVYDDSYSPDSTLSTAPDGVVVDLDGNIWLTGNGQSILYKVDVKTGNRSDIIRLPAIFAQAAAFGGPNYDTIFVSTDAAMYTIETGNLLKLKGGPNDGYMYAVSGLGVKGRPLRKINMRYATCMNDPAALKAQRKRHGLIAKLKEFRSAVKTLPFLGAALLKS